MALEHGHTLLSYADYVDLPDDPRGEVLDGVFVVSPSPTLRHQDLAGEIFFELKSWLRAHPAAGRVFSAPVDVVLRAERPAVVVQPDVLFVLAAGSAVMMKGAIHGAPDLVVEVVSPSSAGRDAITKRDLYARYGTREYWLVWPDEARVDVLVADETGAFGAPRTLDRTAALTSDLLPGFALPLAGLWDQELP